MTAFSTVSMRRRLLRWRQPSLTKVAARPEPARSLISPTAHFIERWERIERIWAEQAGREQDAQLPITRAPDAGFIGYAYAWAGGQELAEVLEDEEMSGGDFVRNIRQLMDLLRQIGELSELTATGHAARQAAEELFRGVVAASSIETSQPADPEPAP